MNPVKTALIRYNGARTPDSRSAARYVRVHWLSDQSHIFIG